MELPHFSAEDIKDPSLFRYLLGNKEFIPGKSQILYSVPYWDEKEINAMMKAITTGKWFSDGENVHKFEIEFSKKFGFDSSVMTNSGSSANLVLIATLKKYFGWKDGNEVIVSCVGFPTTIAPIIQNNLKPVFVDITLEDLNWNIDQVESKITDKTVAVFSSPVLGNPYNFDRVIELCKKYDLKFISDNCDSLGSRWKGRWLTDDSVGASCSFYASHMISTGEGGMVSFHEPELTKIAQSFVSWGRDCYCKGASNLLPCGTCGNRFDKWLKNYDGIVDHKYIFSNIGFNLKPLDLCGAIGREQLKKFDEIKGKRRVHFEIVKGFLEAIPGVRVLEELFEAETTWFAVGMICDSNELKIQLVNHFENLKIQTRNYFAGNLLIHPAYQHLGDFREYPEANKVLERVFFIGCAPHLTDEMLNYLGKVIHDFRPKKMKIV